MSDSLRTSASGMYAQQRRVDVIANNLANVNTTAFKKSRVNFQDMLYETIQGPRLVNGRQGESVGPTQIGKGVRVAGITRLFQQGGAETTERPLDLAINGPGFLAVEKPDGTMAYTRDGSLSLSDAGTLVTLSGYRLIPDITVPPGATAISINGNGMVTAQVGTGQSTELGRVELTRFANPSGLLAVGENLMIETDASGFPETGFPAEEGFGQLMQGMLESSNVEIVTEMTDMIAAQRAYELNARAITAGEEMMRTANDIMR